VKDRRSDLPDLVRDLCKKVLTHIAELTEHLAELGALPPRNWSILNWSFPL
jgi:hypothetical protein